MSIYGSRYFDKPVSDAKSEIQISKSETNQAKHGSNTEKIQNGNPRHL
jgi:hypothetical protein